MSVLAVFRRLSEMEFYKNALFIRKDMTKWLIKDFGYKKNPKNIRMVIKDISIEDQKTVNSIFEKYGKSLNKEFQSEYPEWFINYERNFISDKLYSMITNITNAYFLHPFIEKEYSLRREFQDEAIAACYALCQELAYIQSLFPMDLNRFSYLLKSIDKEIKLLKDWRQSDNRRKGTNLNQDSNSDDNHYNVNNNGNLNNNNNDNNNNGVRPRFETLRKAQMSDQ